VFDWGWRLHLPHPVGVLRSCLRTARSCYALKSFPRSLVPNNYVTEARLLAIVSRLPRSPSRMGKPPVENLLVSGCFSHLHTCQDQLMIIASHSLLSDVPRSSGSCAHHSVREPDSGQATYPTPRLYMLKLTSDMQWCDKSPLVN
jgi:hypothetical protein